MQIVWHAAKASANRRKHAVTFEEASTALADPLAMTAMDPDHSGEESRWLTFGVSILGVSIQRRLLVVAHTEEGDIIRLIGARVANRAERVLHEEGQGAKEGHHASRIQAIGFCGRIRPRKIRRAPGIGFPCRRAQS